MDRHLDQPTMGDGGELCVPEVGGGKASPIWMPRGKERTRKQKATSPFPRDTRSGDEGSSIVNQQVALKDKRPRKSKARHKSNFIRVYSLRSMIESSDFGDSDELDYGSSDMNQPQTLILYPAWEKPSRTMHQPKWKFRDDNRDMSLLQPILSWEEKVLKVIHMIRCRELTEYNPKLGRSILTRFCMFNIALFDLDKESEVKPGPRFSEIPDSEYRNLDDSVNVISIKVAESDVPFPINIYGTVLARDQNDYRCVYLFKRGRDDPQLITEMDDTLTLTGPYRALSGLDSMFFEFHLKIRGDEEVDDLDFSKGLLHRNACFDTFSESRTLSLKSCLSTVDMLYTYIPLATQASIEVNILNEKSNFSGKITASTGEGKRKIILYDSRVAGTELKVGSGGSISLTRSVVSVSHNKNLVLKIYVSEDGDGPYEKLELDVGHSEEFITCTLGSYELQLKIIWTGVFRQKHLTWKKINNTLVLL